jgi:hypothetical protein
MYPYPTNLKEEEIQELLELIWNAVMESKVNLLEIEAKLTKIKEECNL